MNPQPTPASWEQRAERDGRTTTHYVKIGSGNCYLTRGVGQTEAEIQANARLIAAAPDLLERLTECVKVIEQLEKGRAHPAIDLARAALAKATGGAA